MVPARRASAAGSASLENKMSDLSKKIEAQQREMPEPYEGNRSIPWLDIIIVGALFVSTIGDIFFTYQSSPSAYGDRTPAADFLVATPGGRGRRSMAPKVIPRSTWPALKPPARNGKRLG